MSVLKIKDENEQWTSIPTIKGETGDAAGFGTATASVDTGTGTPSCVVTLTGDDTAKNFDFAFHNLMYDDSDLQSDFAAIESDFADLADDFDILQGQFDTAVAAVTTDTEVTDIRVGADGVTDTTAGASVRRQFTDVKSDLEQTRRGAYQINSNDLVQGSYGSTSPTIIVETTTRIRTENPIHCYKGDKIKLKLGDACNGWVIGYWSVSGTWIGELGWVYEDAEIEIESERLVVIVFRNADNRVLTTSDYDCDTTIYTDMGEEVSEIKGDTNIDYGALISSAYISHSTGNALYASGWSCTDFVPITSQSIICNRPYQDAAGLAFYDSEKKYISGSSNSSSATRGVKQTILCPKNALYVRISVLSGYTLTLKGAGNSYQSIENVIKNSSESDLLIPTNAQIVSRSYVDAVTGLPAKYNDYVRTSYIPVYSYSRLSVYSAIEYNVGLAFYDKYHEKINVINSSNISTYGYSTGTAQRIFDIPDGAYYFIACLRSTSYVDTSSFKITLFGKKPQSEVPSLYDPFNADYEKLLGDVLCIGDSLTESYSSADPSYPSLFAKITGLAVTNAGHSGYTAKNWWDLDGLTRDFSSFDTYLIWLGTNGGLTDTLTSDVIPYEDYDDYANTNTGSLCKIISKIISQNANARIFIGTIYIAGGGGDIDTTNAVIYKIAELERYKDNIVGVCNNHDDTLFKNPNNTLSVAMHPYDDTHFGEIGNAYLAKHWVKRIRERIENNSTLYARADGGSIVD